MADYTPCFRTNYFRVKNTKKFKEELKNWEDYNELEICEADGKICLCGWCGVPQEMIYEKEGQEDIGKEDFVGFIQSHLKNDVAILQEIGYEKLRYLVGVGVYISPKEIIRVDINDPTIIKKLGYDPKKVDMG